MSYSIQPAMIRLAYNNLGIQINSIDQSLLTWLQEFLAPDFSFPSQLQPHHFIKLTINKDRYYRLLSQPPSISDDIDTFLLDSSAIRLPIWQVTAGETIVFDEKNSLFCSASLDKQNIEIIAAKSDAAVRLHLMRVVRELAMISSLQRGDLFLHAAAVAFNNRAIIITGEKAAGKTTFLCYLLQQGAKYLANDRVRISFTPQLKAQGMPTIISIRPGTLEFLPQFGKKLLASPYRPLLTIAEAVEQADGQPRKLKDGKYGLSPAQLCALMNVSTISASPVGLLIFPKIDPAVNSSEFTRLSPADAATRLRDSLFGINCWRKQGDLFNTVKELLPPSPQLIEQFTARFACFECRLGTLVYQDDSLVKELLSVLNNN